MPRLLITALLSLTSFASYGKYTCIGEVKGVSIAPHTGDVLVEKLGPLNWPRLCRVGDDYNGISQETCRIIYSTLLTAQTTNKAVTLWFNDKGDCTDSSHKPWDWLKGWYFGPRLND
ncbi:conserved hypothetical protein [Vibrio jasicida]|uniref:Uncharacterized protein n=1 Tax=Vibrio jasicida TaxID=766224 RepID=A0AAU9QFW9_9VIBR|nr:conserved hypothetical protein [Vibrio jasicida]CAH1566113.1 conserved hypothetical protein [Vibrio jasicida]